MARKLFAIAVALVGLAVSACGGRMLGGNGGSAGGGTFVLPQIDSDLVVTAVLPKDTIGEEKPAEGLGQIKSLRWKALLGGYTQQRYSQALGFRPGTKITIRNLSKTTPHTLDVVKVITGPPAFFPKNPKLSVQARGHGKLEAGYASGVIKPGKSVTVVLVKAGIYLIGCAFHYGEGMHDVLVVGKFATHGPQATPPPTTKPSSTPTVRSSYYP
jgi:plastocyanin